MRSRIQVAKKLTPAVKGIVKEHDIGFKNALKLSRLSPEQQEEAASQLAAGTIHSVDEYHAPPALPEPVLPNERLEASAQIPDAASASEGGYYATIKDSVDDLKNPDKDRSRTPDTFFVSFSFFLQRFYQGIANYASPEYAAVFPALTREQLEQLRVEIQSVHTALDALYHKIERKARQ